VQFGSRCILRSRATIGRRRRRGPHGVASRRGSRAGAHLAAADDAEQGLLVVVRKGEGPDEQRVEDHPQRPHIHGRSVRLART
jgi:hypothetical protein